MQELKFRNFIPSLFIFIIAVVASSGCSFFNIKALGLPIPLLLIGLFAGYLILNFISFPKATTVQILQLTLIGLLINAAVLVMALFSIKYLNLAQWSVNSALILLINPLIPAASFLLGSIVLINLIGFEDNIVVSEKSLEKKENQQKTFVENEKNEIVSFDDVKVLSPEKQKQDIENYSELQTEKNPQSLYEELYSNKKKESLSVEVQHEKDFSLNFNEKEQSVETSFTEKEVLQEEFIDFESLPSMKINVDIPVSQSETNQEVFVFIDEQEDKTSFETITKQNLSDENEYFDFIPTDIRLTESTVSKETKSKGKIASIGKLLVNNRDIEGVIESSAALTEVGMERKTNVVSSDSGEQIYEKFNKIKSEFPYIKEISLIDKGGFTLASDYEDKMKIHIAGALIAGAYHTLQNYLAQISFIDPQKIFFETENSNNFILKTNNEFLFSVWTKEFNHIDYSEIKNILENETISESDLIPLFELSQIKNFAIADTVGNIINPSNNSEESKKLAIISSALFENLKVFLMNIQLLKLRRITIFNSEEVITIQKFDDIIASFVTSTDGMVKISDEFAKMEELY